MDKVDEEIKIYWENLFNNINYIKMKKNYILLALSAMSLLVPSFLYAWNDVSGTWWPNNPGTSRCEANKSELMSLSCDKNFDFTLRYDDTYYFNDTFKANQWDKYLWAYCSFFDNHGSDYSSWAWNPKFSWRHRWSNWETKWMVPSNTEKEILRSTDYHIGAVPAWGRNRDNITIRYVVFYSSDEAWNNKFKPHVECWHYQISRCWDGKVDKKSDTSFLGWLETYQEEKCDPADSSHTWWGDDGCSASCEPLNSKCGDGKKSWNEKCDPTDPTHTWWGDDGCSASCEPLNSKCGDGKKSWNEKCDPTDPTHTWWGDDGCSASCEPLNSKCGDGKKSWNEKCDPADPTHTWWWNGWCSLTCEPINTPSGCDKTITWQKLRLGKYYVFQDEFDSKWTTRYLYDFKVNFNENHWDYDNNPVDPKFSWTNELIANGKKVDWKMMVITSPLDPKYHIVSTPSQRAWNNIYIEYIIWYDNIYHSTTPSNSNLYSHKECAYYEITWCGDGVLDTEDGELCDPADPSHAWWGDGWCSKDCKPEEKPWHRKPEKTLIWTNEVTKTWDIITWSLKVTAIDWDVTDFIVSDTMPPVLWYKSYEVLDKWTVDNITFLWENKQNNSVSWKVSWTLKQNKSIEIKLVTYAKEMPKREYDNVLCVWPENEENNRECDKKPIPPVCSSKYNGQTLDELPSKELLCDVWEATTPKYDENTHTWTWECVEDWETLGCWAKKPEEKPWHRKPEKTLIWTNEVTKTWDIITWSLKVTAIDWDVTDFIVSDTMPPVLWYKSYEVLDKWTVDNITFLWENKQNNSVSWKVSWTLKQNKSIEIKLVTYAKEMPKREYDNVLCVRPENEENNRECDKKPIPPVCNSDYNGQTLDELPSEDKLCNVWKATTPKYDENTQRWTWNCVEDWETVGCWAKKEGSKTQTWRLEPLKTREWPKEIHNVWDTVIWKLRVTAKDGDVSDFDMWDDLSKVPVLAYSGYEIVHKWSVDNIVFVWEDKVNKKVTWHVVWTLKEGDYVEIRLFTTVNEMPDVDYENVLCVKSEPNPETCEPEELHSPKLRIRKSFTEWGDDKVVKIWDKIGYKVEFGNNGDASATITSIKDFLPKNVDYITWKIYLDTDSDHEKQESWSEIIDIKRWVSHTAKTVSGVRVDIYTGITLEPGQNGYIILTGEVKDEFTGSRTNFACIYLDNKKIDCDDVTHNITPEEVMCKSNLKWDSKNCEGSSWDVPVKCESSWWKAKIEIFCDNNLLTGGKDILELEWTCKFEWYRRHTAQCKVNWKEEDTCKWTYTISDDNCGGWWGTSPSCESLEEKGWRIVCEANNDAYLTMYCDGRKVEETDEKKKILKYANYNDCELVECYVSAYAHQGRSSASSICKRENDNTDEGPEPLQWCFNVNEWNFSIEEWEIMPFYWNMTNLNNSYWGSDDNYTTISNSNGYEQAPEIYDTYGDWNHTCNEGDGWKIAKDSMVCTFNIYDWDKYHKWIKPDGSTPNNPLYTVKWPCLSKTKAIDTNNLVEARYETMVSTYCSHGEPCHFYFGDQRWESAVLPTAVYYIQNFWKWAGVHGYAWTQDGRDFGLERVNGSESDKSFWEYKIELSQVDYLRCENWKWEQESPDEGPCQSNLMLTNSYTVQKTPSWNIEASTEKLSKYLFYDGRSTFNQFIEAIAPSDYKKNGKVETAMKNFADKYEKLAISVKNGNNSNMKKVPGKNIYFVYGDIEVNDGTFSKPFTIIQKGVNNKVTINWNITNLNMMILTEWNIEFKWDCTYDQTVKWIFYAWKNLSRWGSIQKNTDTSRWKWCTNWWLHIRWVLIWDGFEQLMTSSRSNINDWFIGQEAARKWYVMNWASVVIEYSPSIFAQSTMPPGAEYFTTALDIYKK